MSEKDVLEIGVEITNEGALVAHNANLDKNDQANQRVIASSAKLDSAISRNNATYATLSNQLQNVGRGAQEAFAKFEAGSTKVLALGQTIGQSQKKFDDLNKSLQEAVSSYGENSAEAEALRSELDALGATIASLDTDFASASEELVALGAAFDDSIAGSEDAQAAAADYADSLTELESSATEVAVAVADAGAELGKTGADADKGKAGVKALGDELDNLSKVLSKLPGAAGSAGGTIGQLASFAAEGKGSFAELAGSLSGFALAAGGIAVVVAGVTAAVSSSIAEFDDYGSAVSEAAQKTGLSVEFISGFAEAADDASLALRGTGVEVRDIAGELEGFSLKLGKAIDANGGVSETGKQLSRALNELGVSLVDANGKLKDTPALLGEIADAFQRIGPGPQSEAIARTLDLANALPLLAQGREAVNTAASKAIFTTEDAAALKNYKQATDGIDDALKRLKLSIASLTVVPIAGFMRGVGAQFDAAGLKVKAFQELLKGNFAAALELDARSKELSLTGIDSFAEKQRQQNEEIIAGYRKQGEALSGLAQQLDNVNQKRDTVLSADSLKSLDTRKEDVSTKRENDSNLNVTKQSDLAAARTASALERSAKATETLTKLQQNLAKSADLVASAFDGEVKALGKLETAKVLLELAQGKTTLQDFQKSQVTAGISEGVNKGTIPIAKGVAIAAELGRGNISPQDAALALPATQRKEVLGNIDAVTKGQAEVNRLIAENQITGPALQNQLAQTRVPIVRRLTSNVPLQDTAQAAIAAQQGVKNVEEARKTALDLAAKQGKSEAELRVLGDVFNAPLEAAKKASDKAEKEYNAIKPKIESTTAIPFISQQKQLSELANQRDTTVRELKQRNASQDEINKAAGEFNNKIKAQTELNAKANTLFGATDTGASTTVTTTQVVGARVIGEKGARNIKEQIDKVFGTTGGQAQIDIKLNAAGFEKIEELQTAFRDLKAKERIDLLLSLTGAKDADALFKKLDDAPNQKEIEVAFKASGADTITGLIAFINDPKSKNNEIKFQATLDAFGAKTPEEFAKKLALLSDNEIVIALKASGIDDPEKLLAVIRGQVGAGITVPVTAVPQPIAAGNPLLTPQGFGLPAQITVPVSAGAIPPASTKDANDALDGVKDKTVKLLADNTDVLAKVKDSNTQIAAMPDKTTKLLGDSTDILAKVDGANKAVDAMPNKTVTIFGNNDSASQAIESVRNQLLTLHDKTVTIHVQTQQETLPAKCFAPGTPIATPFGHLAIEMIKAGDSVYAWDHEAHRLALAQVKQVFVNTAEWMRHILFLSGEMLIASFTCTTEHPIWSETRHAYIAASDLFIGEQVLSLNGDVLTVGAAYYTLGGPTHNFEVAQFNNYFASGVLVHNRSEHVDQQINALTGSLARLSAFGAPGAYEEAQRMITHYLLPQTTYNTVHTDYSRHAPIQAQIFTTASAGETMAAFEVMQSMAGGG